jgi:hypothetical protein
MFFVFLNLLEFALVNSYMRQAEKYEKMARTVSKRNKAKGNLNFCLFLQPLKDQYISQSMKTTTNL